jgi:hypothetical protein
MILFTCPLCNHSVMYDPAGPRFCGICCVYVDEVLTASPLVRSAMAKFTRRLATEKPTKAALAQAATWEKAAARSKLQ